jgi:hypothetical protein
VFHVVTVPRRQRVANRSRPAPQRAFAARAARDKAAAR